MVKGFLIGFVIALTIVGVSTSPSIKLFNKEKFGFHVENMLHDIADITGQQADLSAGFGSMKTAK